MVRARREARTTTIRRVDRKRVVTITADAEGRIGTDVLADVQKRLGKLETIGQFLWNTGPWTLSDVFTLGDMKPAWVDFKQMIHRLGAESFDIIGNPETQESTR